MSDASSKAFDSFVDELLDTEEYFDLSIDEKKQKLAELFPKRERTPILEKSPLKNVASEPQKEPEPCLFAPDDLIPTVV